MPKQKGILQLQGALGDLSFYHTKWGWLVRRKGGASKERIATQPAFQRTRENNSEFAHAVAMASGLRKAFMPLLGKAVDKQLMSRLVQALLGVIHTDTGNERGARKVADGKLSLLRGFALHAGPALEAVLRVPVEAGTDHDAGTAWVKLPAFVPAQTIAAPKGATHYRLGVGAAFVGPGKDSSPLQQVHSEILPLDGAATLPLRLETAWPQGAGELLFIVLQLELLQAVNGSYYPLQEEGCCCCAIVAAERI